MVMIKPHRLLTSEEIEKLREENDRLTAENANLKHLLDPCTCTTRPELPVQTISHRETCRTGVSSAQEDTNAPSITGHSECCGSNSTDARKIQMLQQSQVKQSAAVQIQQMLLLIFN